MGVYKDFSVTAKHDIFYSYTCQHCGESSGTMHYCFTQKTNKRKSGIDATLSEDERSELYKMSRDQIWFKLNGVRMDTEKGIFNAPYFDGKCPHCNKNQTWSGGNFVSFALKRAIGLTLLICFLALIPFIFIAGKNSWDFVQFLTYALSISMGSFVILFVLHSIRWYVIKKDSNGAKNTSVPIVDWNGM